MVDQFLLEELQREILWHESRPMNQSAFLPYTNPTQGFRSIAVSNRNMNNRMVEFLRAIPTTIYEYREPEKDRCYRHMINERLRREKQKQSFAALHSMLPPPTKNDKNSIVQKASLHLQEMQVLKEELQKQNRKLEENLSVREGEKANVATIRLRVTYPSSAIDSMLGVLRCLKSMGLKARTIQSEFSLQEFSALMEIETQIEEAEVKNAVQRALVEVERKLAFDFVEELEGVVEN